MKRILVSIILVIVAVLGLSFSLMNAEQVILNYYFSTIQAPLSLVVVLAIAVGALLGMLAMAGVVLGQKREMARMRKSIKLAEKEISNLRSLPLKDTH